MIVIAIVH